MVKSHKWLAIAVAGLIATLAYASPATAQTYNGKLDAGTKEKIYEYKMEADTVYRIDMSSNDGLDTYIRLRNSQGRELGRNDDIAPGNLNSRLIFTAPKTGTYKIVATSFGGNGSGSYVLTVMKHAKAGKATVAKGRLTDKSPVIKNKYPHQAFKVKINAGETLTISVTSSDFDTILAVRAKGAGERFLAFDDDGGEGTNSRLTFAPNNAGEYEILVAPYNPAARGDFTMSYQRVRPAAAPLPPISGS